MTLPLRLMQLVASLYRATAHRMPLRAQAAIATFIVRQWIARTRKAEGV